MICPFWSFDISSYSKLFTCFTCTFLQIHIKQWYLYFWLTEDIKASEELVHLTLDKSRQHWPHQTMLRRDCCRATAIIPITLEHKLETLDHPANFLFLSMLPNFTLYHHAFCWQHRGQPSSHHHAEPMRYLVSWNSWLTSMWCCRPASRGFTCSHFLSPELVLALLTQTHTHICRHIHTWSKSTTGLLSLWLNKLLQVCFLTAIKKVIFNVLYSIISVCTYWPLY